MSLFIELLQISLGNHTELSRVPSKTEWEELFEEAQRQTVAGMLLEGLEHLSIEQRPSQLLILEWIGEAQIVEQTGLLHRERAGELTRVFNAGGFRSVVLKGLSSAERYPNPLRRQCGDIDIWVDGSRKDISSWMKGRGIEAEHSEWHHIGTKFFDDVEVEVHVHPSWMYNPWHNRELQKFFSKNKDCSKHTDRGYNVTTATFDSVYQLTHVFHHLLEEGVGVRHIVDYYYVLIKLRDDKDNHQSTTSEDAKGTEIIAVLRKLGLIKFAAAIMYVMKEVCGAEDGILLCEPDEKEGRFLMNEVMAAGNFGIQRVGVELKRNSIKRFIVMAKHYPSEVLWMIPWKVWHKGWRLVN